MKSELNIPNRKLELYEILERVEKETSRNKKIQILQQHRSPSLVDYCRCLFDDRVVFNLPDGKPPYNASPEESHPSSWHRENRKLAYLVKGLKGDNLIQLKRENIFIGILESIHPRDAEVIVKMKDKEPAVKGFTKKLVEEAFPDAFK